MQKLIIGLISVLLIFVLGVAGLFAFNKYQQTQLEKDKIKLEIEKLKNKDTNKSKSKDSKSNDEEKKDLNQNITNKAAQEEANNTSNNDKLPTQQCIASELSNDGDCNLDNYTTDELVEAHQELIEAGYYNSWCSPGGDPGNIKQQIKEAIYNEKNNISCEEFFDELEEAGKLHFSEEDAINQAIIAVNMSEGGDATLLNFSVMEKIQDNEDEIVYTVAANNKSGSGANTLVVHSGGIVEFWNGPMTSKNMEIVVSRSAE